MRKKNTPKQTYYRFIRVDFRQLQTGCHINFDVNCILLYLCATHVYTQIISTNFVIPDVVFFVFVQIDQFTALVRMHKNSYLLFLLKDELDWSLNHLNNDLLRTSISYNTLKCIPEFRYW